MVNICFKKTFLCNYNHLYEEIWNIKTGIKYIFKMSKYWGFSLIDGVERNTMIRHKMRLLCQTGWCQPPLLIIYLFLFPHIGKQSWTIGIKYLSLSGRILCYMVWMILSILEGVCNGIGYVYLYLSMINNYFVSS